MTEAEKDIQKDFKTAVDIQQTLNNMNAFDAAPAWIEVMKTLKRRRRKTMWKSHTNLTHPGKYFRPSKVKIMRPTSPK